jgi:hypothetical protein
MISLEDPNDLFFSLDDFYELVAQYPISESICLI